MLAKVGQGAAGGRDRSLDGRRFSCEKQGLRSFICVADAEPTAAIANRPKSTLRGSWNFMSEDNL